MESLNDKTNYYWYFVIYTGYEVSIVRYYGVNDGTPCKYYNDIDYEALEYGNPDYYYKKMIKIKSFIIDPPLEFGLQPMLKILWGYGRCDDSGDWYYTGMSLKDAWDLFKEHKSSYEELGNKYDPWLI
jgi:hypothetical protein